MYRQFFVDVDAAEVGVGCAVPDSVIDALGRLVYRHVTAPQAAGRHTLTWDPSAGARPTPSGVYLVRLQIGDATATRRVTVVR